MGTFGGKGQHQRALTTGEVAVIRRAFRTARLPSLLEVTIADGVNGNGGAWTDSDYQINVGPYYFAGNLAILNADLLVHEMTHVWQYYNGTLSKAHAFGAHAQAWIRTKLSLGAADFDAKLYEYDFNDDTWNDMGFEGQAQMMEDWFKKGMLEAGHRYDFINRIVHGNDTVARGQTRSQIVGQSLGPAGEDPGLHPSTAVAHVGRLPLTDALLVELLQQRFAANDVTGYGARARKVERLFGSTNKEEAAMLAARVSVRKQGDKVSMYFHDRLSTPERSKLVHTLQSRAAVK